MIVTIFRNMSCFSHVWVEHDYSAIIIYFTIFPFYHMQCFSGIWDGFLFLHLTNILLSHYPFFKNATFLLSARTFLFLKQNISPIVSFFELNFSQMSRKKIPFYYIWNIPVLFTLLHVFRVLGKHFLFRLSTIFYHFLYFCESAFVSVHNYCFSEFVLITFLIILFTILHFHYITFVSDIWGEPYFFTLIMCFFCNPCDADTWEEPYYFALIMCFFVFHLSQISEKSYINSA